MVSLDNAMPALAFDRDVPVRADTVARPDIRACFAPGSPGAGPVFVTTLPAPRTDLPGGDTQRTGGTARDAADLGR
jgi:hypothetical protein